MQESDNKGPHWTVLYADIIERMDWLCEKQMVGHYLVYCGWSDSKAAYTRHWWRTGSLAYGNNPLEETSMWWFQLERAWKKYLPARSPSLQLGDRAISKCGCRGVERKGHGDLCQGLERVNHPPVVRPQK